jgi:hypothetical protein
MLGSSQEGQKMEDVYSARDNKERDSKQLHLHLPAIHPKPHLPIAYQGLQLADLHSSQKSSLD